MNVFITWFARHVFGDSLLGLRLLPGIAGAALVWMTGQLAREMGGSRFAQVLSASAINRNSGEQSCRIESKRPSAYIPRNLKRKGKRLRTVRPYGELRGCVHYCTRVVT